MKRSTRIALVVVVVAVAVALTLASSGAPYVAGRRTPPPPSAGHTERRLAAADGTSLLVQTWRPASPPRGVLVVVHGLKDYGDRYAGLATDVTAAGFAMVAADLRGHGDSAGDRVWVEHFEQYLSDLDSVMATVRADFAKAPVFLFGHSMGGAIVTTYCQTRAPALAGLIVSAGALDIDAPGPLVAGAKFFSTVLPRLGLLELDDTKFSRDPAVVASMKTDPLIFDGKGPARTAAELLTAIERLRAHPELVKVPLLALHGAADQVTPPRGSKFLVEHAGTKDATLKTFEGVFHDLLHEAEAPQVRAEIVAWMSARTPSLEPPAAPAPPQLE